MNNTAAIFLRSLQQHSGGGGWALSGAGRGEERLDAAEPRVPATSPGGLRPIITAAAALGAAALFILSLQLPVWHLKMESPQYQEQEALCVKVYPGAMKGDLNEIKVLNHYIGVKVPEHLPQLHWLPISLIAAAGLGLVSAFLPRRARCASFMAVALLLSGVMVYSAGLAQWQMHQIGHERDHHAALKGVKDFTPPLLGSVKVANFELTGGLGPGAWLIGAGIVFQLGAAFLSRRPVFAGSQTASSGPAAAA